MILLSDVFLFLARSPYYITAPAPAAARALSSENFNK
jgi:hypothetical protein